ncbi:MAG TPA: hypothetical protein VHD63_16595 [Ktedonobacteraceae bacterium]|nr:hypothetical protein [Ktedonobacteraceae bacterium]
MPDLLRARLLQWPVSFRLFVALLLGLQFGVLAFYQPSSLAWMWVPWLPLVILLAAMVLSIWIDPRVRRGEVEAEQVLQGLVRFLLAIIVPVLVLVVLLFFIRSIGALMLELIPLALGVITAFTLIGSRRNGLAVLCGVLAWLGVGLPFLFSSYLTSRQPGNDLGDLAFMLLAIGVLVGFAFAALGGFLGRMLRHWVLG